MKKIDQFRQFMSRMNPTGDPGAALQAGWYVENPGSSVAEQLTLALELEPTSAHLLLGGIGSGKTSELLRVESRLKERLQETGDFVRYIDVSRFHDLHASQISGVLVALAGMVLAKVLGVAGRDDLKEAVEAVKKHASGYVEWRPSNEPPDDYDDYDDSPPRNVYPIHHHGALTPPRIPVPSHLRDLEVHLKTIMQKGAGEGKHVVLLFDSLDRLGTTENFRKAVEDDLRVLKSVGIGVVVVGPIRFMVGNDRSIANLFDRTHFQLAHDPTNPAELTFLKEVLARRSTPDLLPLARLEPLAQGSGGVIRELISLAKLAGSKAYEAGHDAIELADVALAVDTLGRGHALGLDGEQLKLLRHLEKKGQFLVLTEKELSLIETGRVVVYPQNRWAVHPALRPLLTAAPEG